jgi:hypothetical protein
MTEHALEVDVSPSDALLYTVRRAAGLSRYYRGRLADIDPDTEPDAGRLWAGLERESLRDLARYSKMTLDAGVEEHTARLAERAGDLIAAALDEAIAPLGLTSGARGAVVERFAARLAALEATVEEPG